MQFLARKLDGDSICRAVLTVVLGYKNSLKDNSSSTQMQTKNSCIMLARSVNGKFSQLSSPSDFGIVESDQ